MGHVETLGTKIKSTSYPRFHLPSIPYSSPPDGDILVCLARVLIGSGTPLAGRLVLFLRRIPCRRCQADTLILRAFLTTGLKSRLPLAGTHIILIDEPELAHMDGCMLPGRRFKR